MQVIKLLVFMAFGASVATQLTFVAGPLAASQCSLSASSSSLVADGATTTTLTVLARDAYNNPVVTSVSMAGSGGNNTFGAASGTTDANGRYVTTLSSTQVQSETVTATLGSTASPNLVIQFVAGPAASAQSVFAVSPASQTADNNSVITATLTLKDAQAHPLSGVMPTFSASGNSTTVSTAAATDANGRSAVTYKTSLAQNENAVVTASSLTFTQAMAFVAGPPTTAGSSLTASPNSLLADGSATSTTIIDSISQS